MKKLQLILSLLAGLFILFSCVPPDPAAVYGPNWNNNNNTGNNGISGPRILHKIDSSNVTKLEFFSTNSGVLQQVKDYTQDITHTVVYGSNNKISKITVSEVGNPSILVFNFTYSAANLATKITHEQIVNGTSILETDYFLTYNSNQKVIKVDIKSKAAGVNNPYTHYGKMDITYSGDNVTTVVENRSGFIINGVYEPLDPNMNSITKFENFDGKINPYYTLPKEYNIGIAMGGGIGFLNMNYNNATKMSIQQTMFFPAIVLNTPMGTYDSQNYLIADASGITKYIYKAIQ